MFLKGAGYSALVDAARCSGADAYIQVRSNKVYDTVTVGAGIRIELECSKGLCKVEMVKCRPGRRATQRSLASPPVHVPVARTLPYSGRGRRWVYHNLRGNLANYNNNNCSRGLTANPFNIYALQHVRID